MLGIAVAVIFIMSTGEEITAPSTHDSTNTIPKTAYTPEEQELLRYGSPDLVHRLRQNGISAALFLKAFRWSVSGVRAFRAGSYGDALHFLKKAYTAVKSPMPLYWMGRTYESFGDGAKAAEYYGRFLRISGSWHLTTIKERYRADARHRLARLQQKLVRLYLKVTPDGAELLINGEVLRGIDDSIIKTPVQSVIWLNPGINTLMITKKGYLTAKLVISGGEGQRLSRTVRLLTPAEYVKKSREYRRVLEERRKIREHMKKALLEKRAKAKKKKRLLVLLARTLLGTGTGLLVTSGVLGYGAYQAKNDIESAPDGAYYWHDYSGEHSDFYLYRNTALMSVVFGTAFLAGGWYLLGLADKTRIPVHKLLDDHPPKRPIPSVSTSVRTPENGTLSRKGTDSH